MKRKAGPESGPRGSVTTAKRVAVARNERELDNDQPGRQGRFYQTRVTLHNTPEQYGEERNNVEMWRQRCCDIQLWQEECMRSTSSN